MRVPHAGAWAVAGWLLLHWAPCAEAQAAPNVLMLQSFSRGNLALDSFTGHFRVELDRLAGRAVNVIVIVVSPTGAVSAPEQATVDYIRSTFGEGRKPELIITVGGTAATFAQKYRQELFPDRPILYSSFDQRILREIALGENETAVAVANDFSFLIEDILQLLPDTGQVFMVIGSGEFAKFWHRQLEQEFKRFAGRLKFIWSDDLSLAEILRRCSSLPPDSAIIYINFGTDATGAAYADERVIAELRATANAPLFGPHSVMLGNGFVGGRLMSIEGLARQAAEVAARLLNGASPATIRPPAQTPGQPVFDWRELQRWGVPESRLPPGSVVRYRAPSLWNQHRRTVLGLLAALIVQSGLIAGLVYERRGRQRAQLESRKSLALAADANRREAMSALTSSIAHELGQPISAMLFNASALQMIVSANKATPEAVEDIISDIRAQGDRATQIIDRLRTMLRSRQIDKKLIDLHAVIDETLALLVHEIRERKIEMFVDLSSEPCVITADAVLIQQVLVNLIMNAMDALDEAPSTRRQVTVATEARDTEVALSVRDTGPGVSQEMLDTLFEPFVSTKPTGLGIGLTIACTIVDAHRGSIDVTNNPDGGATFTLTLPQTA